MRVNSACAGITTSPEVKLTSRRRDRHAGPVRSCPRARAARWPTQFRAHAQGPSAARLGANCPLCRSLLLMSLPQGGRCVMLCVLGSVELLRRHESLFARGPSLSTARAASPPFVRARRACSEAIAAFDLSVASTRPARVELTFRECQTSATPVATKAAHVAIAARIPMPPCSIQAGKNAPNRAKEGAPRYAHPGPLCRLVRRRNPLGQFHCSPHTSSVRTGDDPWH
jgi:hypothetical protein